MNQKCELCGEDLEKLGKNHFSCKTCGIGTDGHVIDLKSHLKKLTEMILKESTKHPELSQVQLGDLVQSKLHKTEHHPLDQHDYCIYCNKSFKPQSL